MSALDLERLFASHALPLHRFLLYRAGDVTVAEDLLGETFERIVRSRHAFDPRKGSERTWIYTIVLNGLRDYLRRRKAEGHALERVAADGATRATDCAEPVATREALSRHFELLDPCERGIIALRYGADLRLQDIATVMGLTETIVRGQLHRGPEQQRAAFEHERGTAVAPRKGVP